MKLTLRVARAIDLYSGWDSYSFPSGHVAINAALYGFVTVLIAREETSWRRQGAIALTATVVLFLAFSRLYLGGTLCVGCTRRAILQHGMGSFTDCWLSTRKVTSCRYN
jgi:hypothetical protein